MNESTALNLKNVKAYDGIVPLLILFRKTIGDSITDYLAMHEDESLSELMDAINISVADNIAIMENKYQMSFFEKVIPIYHNNLYQAIQDEINCRTNAYADFKSRRSDVQESCFYKRFGPVFDKVSKDTQSFIKDFMKFLRDGPKDTIAAFKVQIAKWTTDIPNALNCGVTGCVANYVATNKDNILKDINFGHSLDYRKALYTSLLSVKQKAVKSIISNEFNEMYEGIKECYK